MTFVVMGASDSTNANNISTAIMPTGKKRRTSGGGGSGGNISGSTTINAVTATRIRIDTALKNRTMFFTTGWTPLHQIPANMKKSEDQIKKRE